MTARLFLPIGPPGAGKSTLVAKLVAAELLEADAVVSPDTYRRILTGRRADQTANGAVFTIVNTVVDARLYRGLDVWLDATNLPIPLLVADAQAFGAQVVCVPVSVPTGLLRTRNATREHPVPPEVLAEYVRRYTVSLLALPGRVVQADMIGAFLTVAKAATLGP